MGYEPVSPLYPSVGGERCYSFFYSVHPCFLVYSSIGYGNGKGKVSTEGHSLREHMNWLYTWGGLISKQPLPIHIATVFITTLFSQHYQTIVVLFTHFPPNVMAVVTLFVCMLIIVVALFHIWHNLLQHKDDMHDMLKPWERNHAKSWLCFVLAISVTLRTKPT